MNNIRQYLEKYRIKIFGEEQKKNVIITAIHTNTGITLHSSEVIIERGVLALKVDQAVKNELYIHKEKIISLLKENGVQVSEFRF